MIVSRTACRAVLGVLMALVFTLPSVTASAAPKAELWERWTVHDAASTATIDHSAWDRFLKANLVRRGDGINRLAYGRVTVADRKALARYLEALSMVPISRYTRDEQLAYWINLYNALTVKVTLDHYPVKSIRDIDISPGWFSDGPWDKKLIEVEDEFLSLNDIEHRILRPIWRDARVHYAVNCSSLGCPNLAPMAYDAKTMDSNLTASARGYINHPRGVSIEGGRLYVSKIYEWFVEDFGGDEKGVVDHIRHYAKPNLAKRLAKFAAIDGYRYDWGLNDAVPTS